MQYTQVVDEKTPLKSKEMARNRVTLLEQLGKGEFGRYICTWANT